MTRRLCVCAFASLPWAYACRRKASPEERVRALLSAVESAVEAGDAAAVREALSPGFRGNQELDRAAAMAMLQLRLRSPKKIFLFSRVLNLEAPPGATAGAALLVAMAAVPIPSPEALPNLEADVYRFDLVLEEDAAAPHGYRVKSAAWSPAPWPR